MLTRLLKKYAEHGISQLDDLGVLKVPVIEALGSPTEVATRFGRALRHLGQRRRRPPLI